MPFSPSRLFSLLHVTWRLRVRSFPTPTQAQVACSTANADGSYDVPFDWALKPSGLAAGTKFRLLFATSTRRNASATDIGTYNTFVQTRAKAGHSAISDSCGNLFKVVGSTSAIDARVNTDTESTDTAALIYWLNGAKVADSYADFYDGSWDSRAHRTESGGTSSYTFVFTGSNQDGTKSSSIAFGAAAVSTANLNSGGPLAGSGSTVNTATHRFLALSPIFTVGTKPHVTISAGTSPVTEGTAASFTLSVSPVPSAPLDVDVLVSDNSDFVDAANLGFKTVTVPAGAATHAYTVPTVDDTADDASGEVAMAIFPGTDYTRDAVVARVDVTDNDATLVSLVATSDVTFTEETPTDTAAVTVRLARRLYAGENLAVPFEVFGSGVALQDQLNRSYTLSVSGTGVTATDLTGSTAYVRFTGHDTDIVQEATVTVTPTSNDDGNTAAGSLTMELSTLSSGDWTHSFTTVGGGGAPHGTDDEVRLVYADNDVMFDTLTLLDLGGPRIHLDIGTSPGVTGSGRDWTLEEGTDIVLRFSNLTRTLHSQDLVVNYAVAGAKHHVPDGHRGTRSVTLPANTRSVQVTLPTEATTDDETDAELSVMLLAATPPMGETNTLGTYTTNFRPLNFTVTDGSDGHTNRIRPLVTVETWYANPSNDPDEPDKEDPRIEGEDLQFDVRLAPAAQVPFTVWLKVEETVGTGYGDCVAAGQERVRTVRFAPGVSWRTLRVPTVDDDVDEHDCEVTVSLASDAAGTVPAPAQVFVNVDSGPGRGGYGIAVGSGFDVSGKAVATRLVRDNETGPKGSGSDDGIGPVTPGAGPAVTIAADRTQVDEGGDVTFTVTADPAPARDLEVTVSADEEMGSGDDRTGGGHFGTVTVRAGQTTATWTLTTISDQVALADGTVTGRIEAGDGYTVGKPFEVTVALLDDDGVVTQSVTDPVTPGVDAALVAEVTALADGHSNPDAAARLRRVVKGMTGEDGGYTAEECREAATRHGVLSTWKPWCDEIARREAHTPPVPQQQQVMTLPAVSVSAGAGVTEGGDAVFTVTASPAPAAELSVTVTVAATGDFGITAGNRSVTIPTTGSATLTLATANDKADEPDGSVSVTVAAGNGYTVGSPASGSVSIADDDLPPPAVSIAAKAASVTEGGAAAFTLTADRAPDADLTVTLSVAETGGGDHVAAADEGPATAVIAKGATEAVFSVATVDDDVDEPDGSVTVTLKDGGGYTVSPSQGAAAVTVSDNDAAALPSLSVADVTIEEDAWMEFTVRLSAPSAGGVSVKVSTRDSTPVSATARKDYWPLSGRTVSFRAGETERSVGVIVFDDSHDEEAETFEVVLSDARGAAIADGVAVGTIVNDDPMPAAWLARFGRTVAEQALDGIAGRMAADRTAGMQGSIAGQALSFDPAANDNATPGHAASGSPASGGTGALALADVARAFGGQSGHSGPAGFGHDAAGFGSGFDGMQPQSRTMTMQDVLLGSSFSLTGATDGSGGSMAFWGRAAQGG